MTEFCFSTPRIIMQRCFASTTTATPEGSRQSHQRLRDLSGKIFLDLQTTRKDIDNPRHLGQADHFAVWNDKPHAHGR